MLRILLLPAHLVWGTGGGATYSDVARQARFGGSGGEKHSSDSGLRVLYLVEPGSQIPQVEDTRSVVCEITIVSGARGRKTLEVEQIMFHVELKQERHNPLMPKT